MIIFRNFVPKLDEIVSDALDHADPEQGVEDAYSCFNNEIWQWKYGRLFLTEGTNYLVCLFIVFSIMKINFLDYSKHSSCKKTMS